MKAKNWLYRSTTFLLFLFIVISSDRIQAQCGPLTPTFMANLVGAPNGTVITPNIPREDTCCGALSPDKCIKIVILLDQNAMGINFEVYGAVPPGALFYQIGCGPQINVGTPICLNGPGPHILTFCKPGNNINSYGIISIPKPVIPDSVLVRSGCSATLATTGFSVPTLQWNSIAPGAPGAYNSYLNCTSGCATVAVTPTGTPPPFVDYLVSGSAAAPCIGQFYSDTVRVYFYPALNAGINPTLTTICFGSNSAVLTATTNGGLPPYTYTWSTASNNSVVTVGPGTYTLLTNDRTNCPATSATAIVNQFTSAISALPGPNQNYCKTNPNASLNGSITIATGAVWSGGSGVFSPTTTVLNPQYIPTPAEVQTGSVQLSLITTGNSGCPPGTGSITIFFQNPPVVNVGPDYTVCANNRLVALSGTISAFPSTAVWTSLGTGSLSSPTSTNTNYMPGTPDVNNGLVALVMTSTNNGVCPPAADTLLVFITPQPTVNAGSDLTICSNTFAALDGMITGPTNTGTWTTSGNGTFTPSSSALNASYTPGSADVATGTVNLILTSINNGNCLPVRDTLRLTIRKLPVVNAGVNQQVCATAASVALSGSITNGSGTQQWTSNGNGTYMPGNTALLTAYALNPQDPGIVIFTLTAGNNGPCPLVSDTVALRIRPLAQVNAGANQALCSAQNTIALNGTILGTVNTGTWATSTGGNFSPSNFSLSPTYSLTAQDISAGFVTFTLSSTNNGVCPAVRDTVRMRIVKLASVNAGANQAYCSTQNSISLTGTVTGGGNSGIWSGSGSGNYSPGPNVINTAYVVNAADIASGAIVFTLTSQNSAPCPEVQDTVLIRIQQLAQLSAGNTQTLCSNTRTVTLSGQVSGGSGTVAWSSAGTGSFAAAVAQATTTYILSLNDLSTGLVNFTLSSANDGPCPKVSSPLSVIIRQLPVVYTGPDKSICSSISSFNLNGQVTGVTSTGLWGTNGTGTFTPGAAALNSSYSLSPSDYEKSNLWFFLTSTANDVCPPVVDSLKITIDKKPILNLKSDSTICSKQNPFQLNATFSGNTGLQWTTTGSGRFEPVNSANSKYFISTADVESGNVFLKLDALNNGACGAVSAGMNLKILPSPKADFSIPFYVIDLPSEPIVFTNLSTSASTFTWSFGDGVISNRKVPTHTFSNAGFYTVTLIASNEFLCTDAIEKVVTAVSDIKFPNAFTPNPLGANGGFYNTSDLNNDVFFPYTTGVIEYELSIYNRWGEMIFRSNELSKGWDGYFNGKLCQQDAYVWKANVTFFDGRKYNKTGSVTLLR